MKPSHRCQPLRQMQGQPPSPLVVHMDANPLVSELFAGDMEGLKSGGYISSAVILQIEAIVGTSIAALKFFRCYLLGEHFT